MDIIGQWGKTVKDAVRNCSKNQTTEAREDLEQECYLKICELQDVIAEMLKDQGVGATSNYVYRVCHNRILNVVRAEKKHQGHEPLDESVHFLENFKHGITEQELDSAIKLLPREEGHVIRSLFFLSQTERDLGTSLGKNQKYVRKVKDRAIESLKEILEIER